MNLGGGGGPSDQEQDITFQVGVIEQVGVYLLFFFTKVNHENTITPLMQGGNIIEVLLKSNLELTSFTFGL